MIIFSYKMINEYLANNYFGSESTGQSEERQHQIKRRWIEAMRKRSWILDDSIIENDKEYLGEIVDLWLEFERDGQLALVEVTK